MTLVRTEPIIDVEDVVIVLIVVSVVMNRFARLCQDSSWVVG